LVCCAKKNLATLVLAFPGFRVILRFFHFQASQRAVTDIDRRVRKISGAARKYYSAKELSPYLDELDQSTEETLQLMDSLSHSLKCEPIYRCVRAFFRSP
jgi:hypothetical protein